MARRDRFAVGVVLHVNSPGGSALASDQIYREIVRLREKKPVVTCMGDVAASGGYYVAAPTDAIVADATTITGSIGVVTARVVARELFDTLGIKSETIRMAPHADMLSPSRDMSVDERAIIQRETEGFYRTFVGIVADGRKRGYDEMEPLARGRVWSGKDALERGLVDKLGGMEVALDEVRSRVKLPRPILDALEPAIVRPRRLDQPPAEPQKVAQAASLLLGLSPDLLPLLSLAAGGERALYLALGVPRID
jgi:protease-4